MEKKRKTVTAVLFALIIVILPIIFMFSHKSNFSADENRMLAKKPKLSTETIADKRRQNGYRPFFRKGYYK